MLTELADVVVDAIFGTGFTGAAQGPAAEAIELINEAPGAVVSIDIASGVGASTGEVHGPAVAADLTVTLHAAKVGHFVTPGGALSGEVVVVPIGIPPLCDHDADVWLLTEEAVGRARRAQGRARPQALGRHRAGRRRLGAWPAPPSWPPWARCAPAPGWCTSRCPTALGGREAVRRGHHRRPCPASDGQFGLAARSALCRAGGAAQGRRRRPRPGPRRRGRLLVRELRRASTGRCCSTPTGCTRSATSSSCSPSAARRRCSRRTRASWAACSAARRPRWRPTASRAPARRPSAAGATVLLKGEATIVADPSGRPSSSRPATPAWPRRAPATC